MSGGGLDCILLGSGGMMPMPDRFLVSLAVRLNGHLYLFDAGEGTQLAWKRLRLGVRGLKLIAVTHLHADHCLGVPGLMMLRAQMPAPSPLTIVGPPGIRDFVMTIAGILRFHINYELHFHEWSPEGDGYAYRDEEVDILWGPLDHTQFCLGYRLEEPHRPGRFSPQRAKALGIPPGPSWGMLQRGNPVTTPSGERIEPELVLGPPRRGRSVAFVVDTRPTQEVLRLCQGADIAFLEGMFMSEHAQHADAKGHMTAGEAAQAAGKAGVRRAVLVHISPRYENEELPRLEEQAHRHFENVTVGRDLDLYPIPLSD